MGTTEQDADPFVDAVAQLTFVVHRLLTDTASRHDLSVTQLRLLGILRDREPTMQELARRLHLDKSSVTGLIDRAERRGLLQRQTDPRDGRGVRVSLPPKSVTLWRLSRNHFLLLSATSSSKGRVPSWRTPPLLSQPTRVGQPGLVPRRTPASAWP
jgi:DNA-binding MarR family transcriptional regulator